MLLRGVCDKRRFLDLVRHFIVFEDDGGDGVVKKLAGYHQFHAVNIAVTETIRAASAGKSFFSPAVGQVLLQDYMRRLQRTGGEDSYELLSPREREILQLVAEGKSCLLYTSRCV